MTWTNFFVIFGCCAASMLASRVIPFFLLKGKKLPDCVSEALGFIPPAAFAALVANDLFSPRMFDAGIGPAAAPLLAALLVVFVSWKAKSLIWSAVTGVAGYALFALIFGLGF